jgi:hypothetical protein
MVYTSVVVVFALLVAIVALASLATRLRVPYPILLVLGGLVLGFVPGLPRITLDPPAGGDDQPDAADGQRHVETLAAKRRLRRQVLAAERSTLLSLRNEGKIGDDVLRRLERDLDLEERHEEEHVSG